MIIQTSYVSNGVAIKHDGVIRTRGPDAWVVMTIRRAYDTGDGESSAQRVLDSVEY